MAILANSCRFSNNGIIKDKLVETLTSELVEKYGEKNRDKIERGIQQAAQLWEKNDGIASDFSTFVLDNYIADDSLKEQVFYRIAMQLENIYGGFNQMSVGLQKPLHVSDYQTLAIDEMFAQWDPSSHWIEDFYHSKLAFYILLNFPFYTLEEKNELGMQWTDLEWGYARLGDIFTSRIPAQVVQQFTQEINVSDNYVANYNIYMGNLTDSTQKTFFPKDMRLISHWGLRDELKSQYADNENGLQKQQLIYQVFKRIVSQEIPLQVIDNDKYTWNPYSNQIFDGKGQIVENQAEPYTRYEHLQKVFKAALQTDTYSPIYPTYLKRKFEQEFEIPQAEVENLFTQLLTCEQVKEVAALISKRLGRPLQPFDIWYDGFKTRSTIDPQKLDKICMQKYPDKEHFTKDLPHILQKLGFTVPQSEFICNHVSVDASRGAGHAWESAMKTDNARLRTRITDKGMDYKGYNIGVHEFGHNVEQTISLHNVPNYLLRGVPNTAFTEAYAFVFQKRDLQLLGLKNDDIHEQDLTNLDIFWGCYEIMGVSMVDIRVWEWMYKHPSATAKELCDAVLKIAIDVWNQYYAPVFGCKNEPILAVYSHMIDAPLYLSGYPLGHLIEFQYEQYLQGKNIGQETYHLFSQGRLTPTCWLKKGLKTTLSVEPLLNATQIAVEKLKIEN
jgi:hypothetical protein